MKRPNFLILQAGDLAARSVMERLMCEMRRYWDSDVIQAGIDLTVRRRLLIRTAHREGRAPVWGYIAPSLETGSWFRDCDDYGRWSFGVLNPR